MGATHVLVTVKNPGDRSRSWRGRFLVDTGAIASVIPGSVLRGIGIEPETVRQYELADGAVRNFGVGIGALDILGEIVGTTVVFGTDDAEPLLGCTALESAGFEVDPRSQSLRKLPAVRLKAASRSRGAEPDDPTHST